MSGERRLDVLSQGLADVDLLTCDGKLHGCFACLDTVGGRYER